MIENTYTPDVSLPVDNPAEMDNLLRREVADARYVRSLDRDTAATRDLGQIAVNIDYALDHYPNGRPRLEETGARAGRLAGMRVRKLLEEEDDD